MSSADRIDVGCLLETGRGYPGGRAVSPAMRFWIEWLVRVGSTVDAEVVVRTGLPCRRRPDRRLCRGRLEVWRLELPPVIQWQCPRCRDEGEVVGWSGTAVDLMMSRPGRDPEDSRDFLPIIFDTVTYDVVRRHLPLPNRWCEGSLALARRTPFGIETWVPREEIEELMCVFAQVAERTMNSNDRESIGVFIEACRWGLTQGAEEMPEIPDVPVFIPEARFVPMDLNEDLNPNLLGKSPLVVNARVVLNELAALDVAPPSVHGEFSAPFVRSIAERLLQIYAREDVDARRPEGLANLWFVRRILQASGLIRLDNERFRVTAEGQGLRTKALGSALRHLIPDLDRPRPCVRLA